MTAAVKQHPQSDQDKLGDDGDDKEVAEDDKERKRGMVWRERHAYHVHEFLTRVSGRSYAGLMIRVTDTSFSSHTSL